jgi:hypothetical protein
VATQAAATTVPILVVDEADLPKPIPTLAQGDGEGEGEGMPAALLGASAQDCTIQLSPATAAVDAEWTASFDVLSVSDLQEQIRRGALLSLAAKPP